VPRTATAEKQRRTQEERSAATQAALLDATIECLIELGYEGTTTARVAERAGVSRGAHLHHFQTRAALVGAAIERLARRRGEELRARARELPRGAARVGAGLDLLWAQFTGPLFHAAIDLGAAARTDPELRAAMVPVERRLGRETLILCRALFLDDPDDARLDSFIGLALGTIRGLALLPLLQPSGRAEPHWRYARARLIELFGRELAVAAAQRPPRARPAPPPRRRDG